MPVSLAQPRYAHGFDNKAAVAVADCTFVFDENMLEIDIDALELELALGSCKTNEEVELVV